jgi:hypothetical protein
MKPKKSAPIFAPVTGRQGPYSRRRLLFNSLGAVKF